MKQKIWFFAILISLGFFSLSFADGNLFEIRFSFNQDGRKWKKNNVEDNELFDIVEYFLEGQTNDNWTELVTTQTFISRYEFSVSDFFERFIKELAKSHPKNKIDSRIICENSNSLLAEWWIKDKSPNDQYECVHIFKHNNAVGILRYTTKHLNTVQSRGKVWEKILSQATFTK